MTGAEKDFTPIRVGEKCEKCPAFNGCLAMLAARAITGMTTAQEGASLTPQHRYARHNFNKPSDELSGRSAIETVNEVIEDCQGAKEVVTPGPVAPVMFPSVTRTFPGQVYRRRPIGAEKDADKTVVIEPKEMGKLLHDIDPEEDACYIFTEQGDYECSWPEYRHYVSPKEAHAEHIGPVKDIMRAHEFMTSPDGIMVCKPGEAEGFFQALRTLTGVKEQ